jgi:lipopolysaccharide/colanic/teichoic acid biosynthesis glycosyltransferase
VVSLENNLGAHSSYVWEGVVEVLFSIKSMIDILGWIEHRASMGLIIPELDVAGLAGIRDSLDARVRKALADRFDSETLGNLSVGVRAYPVPQGSEGVEGLLFSDPYLYPDAHVRRRGIASFAGLKRAVDIVGSLFLLTAFFPLLIVIAGLIKCTSRGPVLFRQVRIGQMGKPFMICKFRTMRADADHGIHKEYVSWFIKSSGNANKTQLFKLTHDPRITSLGYLLRKTSFDELPQLWNVLRGEMSLVGPRPALWYELQEYKPWHRYRILEAKPGITGLWQVTGRSRTTFDEMVRLDLRYARSQSLWTDIKILLATPAAVISGKGAC